MYGYSCPVIYIDGIGLRYLNFACFHAFHSLKLAEKKFMYCYNRSVWSKNSKDLGKRKLDLG